MSKLISIIITKQNVLWEKYPVYTLRGAAGESLGIVRKLPEPNQYCVEFYPKFAWTDKEMIHISNFLKTLNQKFPKIEDFLE